MMNMTGQFAKGAPQEILEARPLASRCSCRDMESQDVKIKALDCTLDSQLLVALAPGFTGVNLKVFVELTVI